MNDSGDGDIKIQDFSNYHSGIYSTDQFNGYKRSDENALHSPPRCIHIHVGEFLSSPVRFSNIFPAPTLRRNTVNKHNISYMYGKHKILLYVCNRN